MKSTVPNTYRRRMITDYPYKFSPGLFSFYAFYRQFVGF